MRIELIVCHSDGGPEGFWETIETDVPDHLQGNSDAVVEWLTNNTDIINDCGDNVVYVGVFAWDPLK